MTTEQEEQPLGCEEKLEELITEVKNRKILYDSSSSSNRNKHLKEAAWSEVSKAIGKDDLWCKTEWGKLRAGYQRRKKNLKGKTGQARKRIEAWCHFLSLQFLDEHELVASTTGNVTAQREEPFDQDDEQDLPEENSTNLVEESASGTNPEKGRTPEQKDFTYSAKRHAKRASDSVDEEIVNYLKRSREQHDEHHHFALGIAEQLRKMTPEDSSYTKLRIQQLIHDTLFPKFIIEVQE